MVLNEIYFVEELTIYGSIPSGRGVVSVGGLDDELVCVEIDLAIYPLIIALHRVVSEVPDVIYKPIRVLGPDLQGPDATLVVEVEVEIHAAFAFLAHFGGYGGTVSSFTPLFRVDIKERSVAIKFRAVVSKTLTALN